MKKFFPILLLLMAGSAVNAGGLSTRHQTSLQFINDGGHTEYTRMGASYSISGTNASTTHTVGNNDPVTGGLGVQSYAANGVATLVQSQLLKVEQMVQDHSLSHSHSHRLTLQELNHNTLTLVM